jgi:hypothetical protein
MKTECSICGQSCKGDITLQPDSKYILRHNSPVCLVCFKLWTSDNEAQLLKRIESKLTIREKRE